MESTEEEKSNIKLYPIYKMLSWDLLFYYSIIFIFLVQIKHISPADVLLGEAFYPFFKFILLMPMTAFIEKIGKKRSLIIANSANAISILCYILAQNFTICKCFLKILKILFCYSICYQRCSRNKYVI